MVACGVGGGMRWHVGSVEGRRHGVMARRWRFQAVIAVGGCDNGVEGDAEVENRGG
nr:hypothetical protein Itr_chr06CG19070 [Ipomoea trifida]